MEDLYADASTALRALSPHAAAHRSARFHFLHGGVLRGVLSAALEQHELPVGRLCADCYGASVGLGEMEEGAGGEPWILV